MADWEIDSTGDRSMSLLALKAGKRSHTILLGTVNLHLTRAIPLAGIVEI
jgi:hypothetical protein